MFKPYDESFAARASFEENEESVFKLMMMNAITYSHVTKCAHRSRALETKISTNDRRHPKPVF